MTSPSPAAFRDIRSGRALPGQALEAGPRWQGHGTWAAGPGGAPQTAAAG